MGDLFDDEEELEQAVEDEVELDLDVDVDLELDQDEYQSSPAEARRRLESLLAEKKLRDELEDFFDDIEE